MNRYSAVSLDSYRLAKYADQHSCYVCGGGNSFDAELCRHCFAPMALAHQAGTNKKAQPQLVTTIGTSNVGKTVYLGMLMDMLSRQAQPPQAVIRGAFSLTLQQSAMAALADCLFPEKTPAEPDRWNWVHCTLKSQEARKCELVMADMAGEAILEEIDHPNSFPVIGAMARKCAGALLMVDSLRLQEGRHEQEHFAMKVLSFLKELDVPCKRTWRDRPIALVLTKADQSEICFDDPASFVKHHAPGVWKICTSQFTDVGFFASSVTGACAYRVGGAGRVRIPLRVEPRGIIQPFAWLTQRLPVLK